MSKKVQFFNHELEFSLAQSNDVSEWIESIVKKHKYNLQNLSIIFTNDEYLLSMNQQHLQHDYYTDIITFDYRDKLDKKVVNGELYISVDRINDNANTLNLPFIDELHRVIIHGVLHLCGFGDKSDEEEIEMRKQENIALALRLF